MASKKAGVFWEGCPSIAGSGGASQPDPPPPPEEIPDNLRSNQLGRLIDLICEGPIEGFPNGPLQDVFLNESPLDTFETVDVQLLKGDVEQEPVEDFPGAEVTTVVKEKVRKERPVVRTINDPLATRVRVNLYVPALLRTKPKTGDVVGHNFSFRIEVKRSDQPESSYVGVVNRVIRGKTRSGYGFAHDIDIRALASAGFGVDIKVIRISPDPPTGGVGGVPRSEFHWINFVTITDVRLQYPGSAMVAMRVRANEFDRIPSRQYRIRMRKILVPSNYDPETRTYTGDWDGTFQGPVWSNNPAWVLYDLILSTRAGLGNFVEPELIDKWALYEAGQFCDELVPSGRKDATGADILEPRFTANMYLQKDVEAYKVIQDLSSVFWSSVFWYNGMVSWAQDRPRSSGVVFHASNVIDGVFTYTGSSRRVQHTVAKVRWNDPQNFYLPAVEYVEDQQAIAERGAIIKDVTAIATTSRGQARRLGRWVLESERANTLVTFKTGLNALELLPGEIIEVVDPTKTAQRQGGRTRSYSDTRIELDREVTLQAGTSYDLTLLFADRVVEVEAASGTTQLQIPTSPAALSRQLIIVRVDTTGDGQLDTQVPVTEWTPGATDEDPGTVTIVGQSTPGVAKYEIRYPQGLMVRPVQGVVEDTTTSNIEVTQAFKASAPTAASMWVLSERNTEPKQYRVVNISEVSEQIEYEVTALEYDVDKFDRVLEDLDFDEDEPVAVPRPPTSGVNPKPQDVGFETELRSNPDGTRTILHITWRHPKAAEQRGYLISYSIDERPFQVLAGPGPGGIWTYREAFIWDARPGRYVFQIIAVNAFQRKSKPATASYELASLTPIDTVRITHLRLIGEKAGASNFTGREPTIAWQLSAPNFAVGLADDNPLADPENPEVFPEVFGPATPAGEAQAGTPIGVAGIPFIKEFRVRVWPQGTTNPLDTTPLADSRVGLQEGGGQYTFKFEDNLASGIPLTEGRKLPRRALLVGVSAVDVYDRQSDPEYIEVQNPEPLALQSFGVRSTFETIWVSWTRDRDRLDADFEKVLVWASTEGPDFPLTPETEVAAATSSPTTFDTLAKGVRFYVRAAAADAFFPLDDYTDEQARTLLNPTSAREIVTPVIDGGVDIKEQSIGRAQIQEAIIGQAQIDDLAVTTAKIDDLAVDTLKIAGGAVSEIVERVIQPKTIIDTDTPVDLKGAWKTVADVPIITSGGTVTIFSAFFAEVAFVNPSLTTGGAVESGNVPLICYRLVRDPGSPQETTVFMSGKLSISVAGYFVLGSFSRLDQPPPGEHTYRLQFMPLEDVYEAGTISYLSDNGSTTQLEAVGTRFRNNVTTGFGVMEWQEFDSGGSPVGTKRTISSVVSDTVIEVSGTGLSGVLNAPYKITPQVGGVLETKLIIDMREPGFIQVAEAKR